MHEMAPDFHGGESRSEVFELNRSPFRPARLKNQKCGLSSSSRFPRTSGKAVRFSLEQRIAANQNELVAVIPLLFLEFGSLCFGGLCLLLLLFVFFEGVFSIRLATSYHFPHQRRGWYSTLPRSHPDSPHTEMWRPPATVLRQRPIVVSLTTPSRNRCVAIRSTGGGAKPCRQSSGINRHTRHSTYSLRKQENANAKVNRSVKRQRIEQLGSSDCTAAEMPRIQRRRGSHIRKRTVITGIVCMTSGSCQQKKYKSIFFLRLIALRTNFFIAHRNDRDPCEV